jgi:hypothetical protein
MGDPWTLKDTMLAVGSAVGAIGAVGNAAWNVRNWRLDRDALKIAARVDDQGGFYFTLTNIGRRVINVRSLHMTLSDGTEKVCIITELPKELGEKQQIRIPGIRLEWAEQSSPAVTGFYFLDSLGTRWPLSRSSFRTVKAGSRAFLGRIREQLKTLKGATAADRSGGQVEAEGDSHGP